MHLTTYFLHKIPVQIDVTIHMIKIKFFKLLCEHMNMKMRGVFSPLALVSFLIFSTYSLSLEVDVLAVAEQGSMVYKPKTVGQNIRNRLQWLGLRLKVLKTRQLM